jgi:hypothetical protein
MKSYTGSPLTASTREPGGTWARHAGPPGTGSITGSVKGTPLANRIGKTTAPNARFISTPPEKIRNRCGMLFE